MEKYDQRIETEYENLSQSFIIQSTNYNRQYYGVYMTRLKQTTELLLKMIEEKWKNAYPMVKLYKLSEEKYEKCIVIGTLFKNQKLKPSILKQIAEGNQLVQQPILTHFTNESDELFIEDELQRFQLVGSIDIDKFVTGITCALLGCDEGKGKFKVDEMLFIDYMPQISRPIDYNEPVYVAIVSGLDFSNIEKYSSCSNDIFIYWLSNFLCLNDDIKTSNISRLIIAGNSIRSIVQPPKAYISLLSKKPESSETFKAVELFDDFLQQLTEVITVDLMPGENDPSNHILPQQPMHHCLFPLSGKFKSLNRVPNPYKCSINGTIFLGTSGQNITDIVRYSKMENPLDCMEACLKWGHIAPTAPDTLGCYPFNDEDPFILKDCPHVFFAGNQSEFGTKIVQGPKGQKVTLISIPSFTKTGEVCLVDLKSLECKKLRFQISEHLKG